MPKEATQIVLPIDTTLDTSTASVFSDERTMEVPPLPLPPQLKPNRRLVMDGLEFLSLLPDNAVPVAFFDPQYRGVLDKLSYGNEGMDRGRRRCALQQMSEATIAKFILDIGRVLVPSGHLFLWIDKFHLCEGFKVWLDGTALDIVDLVTWDKGKMGMGYRTRRTAEYCAVLQKRPHKAKGVWKIHNIADVWREKVVKTDHPHSKPVDLQGELMAAVSNEGDFVIDPAAGSFSVLQAARNRRRTFLGCDLDG
jgi:site-specific DNA-methyltransferase (adenine-specific)